MSITEHKPHWWSRTSGTAPLEGPSPGIKLEPSLATEKSVQTEFPDDVEKIKLPLATAGRMTVIRDCNIGEPAIKNSSKKKGGDFFKRSTIKSGSSKLFKLWKTDKQVAPTLMINSVVQAGPHDCDLAQFLVDNPQVAGPEIFTDWESDNDKVPVLNIAIMGASGSGKTEFFKAVRQYLEKMRQDCNSNVTVDWRGTTPTQRLTEWFLKMAVFDEPEAPEETFEPDVNDDNAPATDVAEEPTASNPAPNPSTSYPSNSSPSAPDKDSSEIANPSSTPQDEDATKEGKAHTQEEIHSVVRSPITALRYPLGSTNGYLIIFDVPGFDSHTRTNTEVLEDIGKWLKQMYQSSLFMNGFIYLQDITDPFINVDSGAQISISQTIFKDICGDQNHEKIALVTTKWDEEEHHNTRGFEARETIIKETQWRSYLRNKGKNNKPSFVARFDNGSSAPEKAIGIVARVLQRSMLTPELPCLLQREMVDGRKKLVDTTAGLRSMMLQSNDDIIIAVVGSNGSGKTTFIRSVVQNLDLNVTNRSTHRIKNHDLEITTMGTSDSRRLVLIDTPGWTMSGSTALEIQEDLTAWLIREYNTRRLLNGLILVEPITNTTNAANSAHKLDIFAPLFGGVRYERVALATSHWDIIQLGDAEAAKERLQGGAWSKYLRSPEPSAEQNNAFFARFDNHRGEDAVTIVSKLIQCSIRDAELWPPWQHDLHGGRIQPPFESILPTVTNKLSWSTEFGASKYEEMLPDDRDVVIMIMGSTGAGKTTFINSLKSSHSAVHHDLTCGTKDVNVVTINLEHTGKRLVLVDTPGFDDSYRSNAEILECVAVYLERTYRAKKMLDGMIYLYRITDIRFDSESATSLKIFQKLFGDDHFERLALVTTMWNDIAPGKEDIYVSRENYMKQQPWAKFLQRTNASLVARFNCGNGSESDRYAAKLNVLDIVTGILMNSIRADASRGKKSPGFVVQLQRELVDQGKALPRTEAGKAAFTLAETANFYVKI